MGDDGTEETDEANVGIDHFKFVIERSKPSFSKLLFCELCHAYERVSSGGWACPAQIAEGTFQSLASEPHFTNARE